MTSADLASVIYKLQNYLCNFNMYFIFIYYIDMMIFFNLNFVLMYII